LKSGLLLTEKMSAFRPAAKQAKTMGQTQVRRTESVDLAQSLTHVSAAEKNPPTASPLSPSAPTEENQDLMKIPKHPKGHIVRELESLWKTMDGQTFLHMTDTSVLGDIWVQPKSVEPSTTAYVNVCFIEIIVAPHIKSREATCKMSIEDLLKMLYLNDCLQYDAQGTPRLGFDEWISEKTAAFIKAHGVDDATNRSKLCNFIITEDETFSFYPACFNHNLGVFFRKIHYHSYKTSGDGMEGEKIINPSMVKCQATRGKFEYILEARVLPLPEEWKQDGSSTTTEDTTTTGN